MSENAKSTAASTTSSQQPRFSARFVKENPHDKYEIVSGAAFFKTWWMRNDGEVAWPAGTKLVQTSGDNIGAAIFECYNPIAPGDTVEMKVNCKAPEKEGRYTAFFRLQTGRIKFGHKVSCDILVVPMPPVDLAAEIPREQLEARINNIFSQPAPIQKEEPVQMLPQDTTIEAVDKQMDSLDEIYADNEEAPAAKDAPMEEPKEQSAFEAPSALLNNSVISIDAKSPKQIYMESVEAETDVNMQSALKALYDFGFTNFGVNKMLMIKHNDVNVVAEQLMTGALSESQFQNLVQE